MTITNYTHRVTIRVVEGQIVLDDGHGGQGDLKVNTGDSIEWVNETGRICVLRFYRLKIGRVPEFQGPAWPFAEGSGSGLNIGAAGTERRTVAKSRVGSDPRPCYVKYDVFVTGDNAPEPLDPVIIIDN